MQSSLTKRKPGRPPKFPKADEAERSMIRFQVSMRPHVYAALEKFRDSQQFRPERSEILDKLVEAFLIKQGYMPSPCDGF